MKTLANNAKMNACRNATNSSNMLIATPIPTGSTAIANDPKVKIRLIIARSTTCPAIMFANNRIASANGFVSYEMNSIGVMMKVIGSLTQNDMSCGQ